MIQELLAQGLTENEVIKLLIERGWHETEAREVVAIETGRSKGDRINLDAEAAS